MCNKCKKELEFVRALLLEVLEQLNFNEFADDLLIDTHCISAFENACLYLEYCGMLKLHNSGFYSDGTTRILRVFEIQDRKKDTELLYWYHKLRKFDEQQSKRIRGINE